MNAIIRVVDDDGSFRNAIARLLRAGGYVVQTFASATEFLQSARTDACKGARPGLTSHRHDKPSERSLWL